MDVEEPDRVIGQVATVLNSVVCRSFNLQESLIVLAMAPCIKLYSMAQAMTHAVPGD
jgi:hypothetical protein